jgi:hypothetical protein
MEINPPTLGFLLHDVARLLKKRLEQHSRGSGLTRSQWQILAYLAQNEGINQKGLAEPFDIEAITTCCFNLAPSSKIATSERDCEVRGEDAIGDSRIHPLKSLLSACQKQNYTVWFI